MYNSPIEMTYGELQTQMMQEEEELIMKAVRNVGVNVDKGELIKALQYDRDQYTKGYKDGKNEVLDKIRAKIKYMDFDFGDFYDHTETIIERVLEVIDKVESEDKNDKT